MKDQFVIAYLADFSMTDAVLSYASHLSLMLNKGLILLYIEDSRYGGPTAAEAETRMIELEKTLPELHPAHVCLKKGTKEVINVLPTLLNGVVSVAGVNAKAGRRTPTHPKQVLSNFAECKIAYLTVQAPLADARLLKNVAYSVDFKKETKEKLVWGSYFARFNKSQLHALSFDYTDETLHNKWQNNIRFMNKIFAGLNITYQSHTLMGRAVYPETIACQYAAEHRFGLLLSVTTNLRDRDIVDLIAGTQEDRTICNKHMLPILFLNPRDDIYVLCD